MSPLRKQYLDCRFGQAHLSEGVGSDPAAKPLLMMNTRSRSLPGLIAHLGSAYRPIIIDIPGSGNSSPPPAGSTMTDIAANMVDCLDQLGIEKLSVFGFHTGHKVTAALAAAFPERVEKIIIAGKTHSLVVDQEARNASMQRYLDKRLPDTAIVQMEGKFVDDTSQSAAWAAMFHANFSFDFAESLTRIEAETLLAEIVTEVEDGEYGRQGPLLAPTMPRGSTVALTENDPTGVYMYIGHREMADVIKGFIG